MTAERQLILDRRRDQLETDIKSALNFLRGTDLVVKLMHAADSYAAKCCEAAAPPIAATGTAVPDEAVTVAIEAYYQAMRHTPVTLADPAADKHLARAVLEAAAPLIAAAERDRIRHALLDCRDCGKIHESRPVPKVPENMTGHTYLDPDDGHPYALTLQREVVDDVLKVAALLTGTP